METQKNMHIIFQKISELFFKTICKIIFEDNSQNLYFENHFQKGSQEALKVSIIKWVGSLPHETWKWIMNIRKSLLIILLAQHLPS